MRLRQRLMATGTTFASWAWSLTCSGYSSPCSKIKGQSFDCPGPCSVCAVFTAFRVEEAQVHPYLVPRMHMTDMIQVQQPCLVTHACLKVTKLIDLALASSVHPEGPAQARELSPCTSTWTVGLRGCSTHRWAVLPLLPAPTAVPSHSLSVSGNTCLHLGSHFCGDNKQWPEHCSQQPLSHAHNASFVCVVSHSDSDKAV